MIPHGRKTIPHIDNNIDNHSTMVTHPHIEHYINKLNKNNRYNCSTTRLFATAVAVVRFFTQNFD